MELLHLIMRWLYRPEIEACCNLAVSMPLSHLGRPRFRLGCKIGNGGGPSACPSETARSLFEASVHCSMFRSSVLRRRCAKAAGSDQG